MQQDDAVCGWSSAQSQLANKCSYNQLVIHYKYEPVSYFISIELDDFIGKCLPLLLDDDYEASTWWRQ